MFTKIDGIMTPVTSVHTAHGLLFVGHGHGLVVVVFGVWHLV